MNLFNPVLKVPILCAIICSLSGCAYGPSTKDKSFLESLNGKHYEPVGSIGGSGSIGNVPVLKRHQANVTISGRVTLLNVQIPAPVSLAMLELIQDGKSLAQARTNGDGTFTLSGTFPDGLAFLHLASNKYDGEYSLIIKGFEINDIDFYVHLK